MSRPVIAEMVVAGGGVIGAAVAYRLAQAGVGVTLVESRYPGAGISSASFSWVNSFDKKPLVYHQFNVRGIGEHWALAAELGSQDLLHLDGALAWGGPEPGGTAAAAGLADSPAYRGQSSEMGYGKLAAKVNATRLAGYLIEEITPAEAMDLEPDLVIDADQVPVVYLKPMEGWLETAALAHRLVTAAARRYGLRSVLGAAVTGVDGTGGAVRGVALSDGTRLACDVLVNATGPEGGRFAAMAGGHLPLQNSIGINFVTSAIATQLRRVVHAGPVQLRPESATRVMMGGQNVDGTLVPGEPYTADDPRGLAELAAAALVMPALRHATLESIRTGMRALPGDGLSAIGPDVAADGLYHAITHSGATLSALVGRLACADLLGANPPELEPFRPARFASGNRLGHAGSNE